MDLLNDLFIYILGNISEIPLESQKLELEAIFPWFDYQLDHTLSLNVLWNQGSRREPCLSWQICMEKQQRILQLCSIFSNQQPNEPGTDKETDGSWDIHIYDMKNQFWDGLGSRASTCDKSLGSIMSNFWGQFFYVFMGKK